jgi:DNA-binding transcriptional LysR family regulator
MTFTLDQLLLLDAIARTGSFAAAARELHRVPSGASYTVKALEDALGVALFDRDGHRAQLTAAGRLLLTHARDVLREAGRLQAAAAQLRDGWEPELRVVVDGALPMGPLTAALRAFSARQVPTRIRVDVEHQDGVADRFLTDGADLMLALELDAVPPGLSTWPLGPLELVLVVSAAHPLAHAGRIQRSDLHRYVDLVVRDSAPRFARAPRQAFLGSPNVVHLSDFHAKRLALLGAAGFGWIPRHLVADDLAAGALVPVELDSGSTWTYLPRLVTRDEATLGRAARLFLDALLAASPVVQSS